MVTLERLYLIESCKGVCLRKPGHRVAIDLSGFPITGVRSCIVCLCRVCLTLLVAFVGLRHPSVAQEVPLVELKVALQERLDKTCREHNLPALWAGKFSLDGSSIVCASGVRKIGASDKAEPSDVVHLGSCTKAMTATLIGQLCSEGKLRLNSTLREIFSDMPELAQSSWAEVTVQELLQHRSGAPANLDYHAYDRAFPDAVVDARRLLLKKLIGKRRAKTPTFVYSNVGYIVLGHIVEQIDKKPWEEAIAERLFKPLQMESAAFGPVGLPDSSPTRAEALPDRAWGHREPINLASAARALLGLGSPPKLEPVQIDNARCLGPAGRVQLNLRDWSKFVNHFADPQGYKALNISKEIWQELLKPSGEATGDEAYAAGWIPVDNPELGQGLFHNGSNTTWYSYAFAVRSAQCSVLVVTNVYSESARRECDAIARFLLKPELKQK